MEKLLVANRGEIARRVFRTAKALGVRTVAVFSDADADLPYVREADEAVRIGPPAPAASYLDAAKLIEAARRTGADAVHPGYGFLSERASFARAVIEAGLTWVGPSPEAIAAMGDKAAARRLAAAHGVPTVPGYDGADQSDATFVAEADRIGFPVLVKAAAGGGGRGMRRVDDPAHLVEALASARREAQSAFGDGTLLLERYVERPRHVEVQVLGDQHGHVVHLFERECSIQRRHQKVFEEAPSPAVGPDLRERLGAAAVAVAKAVSYAGAGTVEFLLDPEGRFYFLEMNTRLQVEHPVTEAITGLDLVALQIAVADGEPLPFAQSDLRLVGHAIEARVCAEDPLRDYLPASGPLVRFDLGDEVRVDAGYESGGVVGIHYDSLLAKVIAFGRTRAEANRKLRRALDRAWIPGVVTNLPLLRQVVGDPAWQAGDLDTGFLARRGLPVAPPLNLERGALAATTLAWWRRRAPYAGWRVEGTATSADRWACGSEEIETTWRTLGPDRLEVGVGEARHAVRVGGADGDVLRVEVDGVATSWRLAVRKHFRGDPTLVEDEDVVYAHLGDGEAMVRLVPRFPPPKGVEVAPGSCVAPTPGTVTAILAAVGDRVARGAKLATLEAMKMEHAIVAPEDGTVAAVLVDVGQAVEAGAVLLRVEPAEPA